MCHCRKVSWLEIIPRVQEFLHVTLTEREGVIERRA